MSLSPYSVLVCREICGSKPPWMKEGQNWTLLSALAPKLLGKSNLPSSSLALIGWCGLLCQELNWMAPEVLFNVDYYSMMQ